MRSLPKAFVRFTTSRNAIDVRKNPEKAVQTFQGRLSQPVKQDPPKLNNTKFEDRSFLEIRGVKGNAPRTRDASMRARRTMLPGSKGYKIDQGEPLNTGFVGDANAPLRTMQRERENQTRLNNIQDRIGSGQGYANIMGMGFRLNEEGNWVSDAGAVIDENHHLYNTLVNNAKYRAETNLSTNQPTNQPQNRTPPVDTGLVSLPGTSSAAPPTQPSGIQPGATRGYYMGMPYQMDPEGNFRNTNGTLIASPGDPFHNILLNNARSRS